MWGCFMATEALSLTQTAVIARYVSARWLLVFDSASLQYMQYCVVILDIEYIQLLFLTEWHRYTCNF